MSVPFRFRYANEIAGGFVILAFVLTLAGIFAAGRYQGWFEGRFVLETVFLTDEGSFGLKEGAEIVIKNTVAGRVGKIVPTAEGHLTATFVILERFHPFVRQDSIARVRKKFGVAGDAFVEISLGRGVLMPENARIECRKDEELTEIAQRALKQAQEVLLPMLEEVQKILKNVEGITAAVQKGPGLAGAMLNDPAMVTDVKGTLASVTGIMSEVQGIMGGVKGAMDEVQGIIVDAHRLTGQIASGTGLVGTVLSDTSFAASVQQSVHAVNTLMGEAQGATRETKRLIEGVQRHWLLRKYVPRETPTRYLLPGYGRRLGDAITADDWRANLAHARLANDGPELVRAAYNLSVLALDAGQTTEAEALRQEIEAEPAAGREASVLAQMLAAQSRWITGPRDAALALARAAAQRLDKTCSPELKVQAHWLAADRACEMGQLAVAQDALQKAERALRETDSPVLTAAAQGLAGRLAILDQQPAVAATAYEREASVLRTIEAYPGMAAALNDAGAAHARAGAWALAAQRHYEAGRSLMAAGRTGPAQAAFEQALAAAARAADTALIRQIEAARTPGTVAP